MNQVQRKLEAAIEQGKSEYILNQPETLLVSASEELKPLGQKEIELIKNIPQEKVTNVFHPLGKRQYYGSEKSQARKIQL